MIFTLLFHTFAAFMIRNTFTVVLLLAFISSAFGQGGSPSVGEGTVLYKKELAGGIILHTNGWGGLFKLGRHKTAHLRTEWVFQAANMKHPKELKTFNPNYENSKGYIYGKEHSFFVFRTTWGQRHVLFDKMRNRGVEFGFNYAIGPVLGLTKPIYLEIGYPGIPYVTVERYNSEEHFIDNIAGKAPGVKGLNELKPRPGVHARFGLHFEYANAKDRLKGLEAGVALDAYPDEVPIMALIANKQMFFTFYINLLYGKKYFR